MGAGTDEPSAQEAFLAAVHLPAFSAAGSFAQVERTRDLHGADLVVMGVQFDLGAVNRPGARFGPRAIRQQSIYAGALRPVYPWDEDLLDVFRVIDYGDVVAVPGTGSVESMIEQTQTVAAEVFRAGASLLTLGGDHTLPYGPVRAAAEAFGPLALIHLDAHQDSIDGGSPSEGGLINHGTFATGLVKEGHIDATRSAQLYIRTTMDNPAGYTIHHAEEARELGPEGLAEAVRELAGDGPVYLSLDVDAVDPAYAPGVGTPVPGGPTSGEVRRFLRHLDGLTIVAADLVELNPPHDPAEVTAVLAAFLSFDLLHLMGRARRRRG